MKTCPHFWLAMVGLAVLGSVCVEVVQAQAPPPPPPPPESRGEELGEPRKRDGGPRQFRPGGQGGQGGFGGRMGERTPRNREGMMRLRQHLNKLAQLPPDQLQQKLDAWPPYQSMDERQRKKLMERIEKLRARRGKEAMNFARRAGLVIPPDQQPAFVNRFWELRLAQEKQTQKKMEALKKESHRELKSKLVDEYGDYLSPDAAKPPKDGGPKKDGA